MANNSALIIFVKAPELGKVKTRIAKTEGDETALNIYESLLRHTRIVAEQTELSKYLFYAFSVVEDDAWDPSLFTKKLQVEGNLGDKMQAAFKDVLSQQDKAIIIGSDCGELGVHDIERAESMLDDCDVVIGPAEDGGYYLLGMKTYYPELFENKSWSQDNLFEETIQTCEDLNLRVQLLDLKSDVDYIADWLKVKDSILQ